ncbi:hypothetical protein CF15_06920 [Pyrodictium occultum]|uniref:Uncharacterized protein n=1 Tax=Pyrodictium occultum TaxID=2309 RepID=A0A0V8RWV5_PYROC|nr:hypothetical protein [Pyrodictium occultum]KSW12450.1 hypothetical protein CF15_06920 [Pyrodictium occultum]
MKGPYLDLRGYRGFIPYRELERSMEGVRELRLAVDPEAVPLVEAWARLQGLQASLAEDGTLRLARRGDKQGGAKEKVEREAAAPPLWVDHGSWDSELSKRLSDAGYIVNTVIQAPVLYRGHPSGFNYDRLRGRSALLRVTMPDSDYFLAVRGGRVVAAAQLGKPLSPRQAETLLATLQSSSEALLTVYNTSV